MRTIEITKNDAGQRLDKFLGKRFKTLPKSLMYKYLRTKYIKLNGKKSAPEAMLCEGDILTLYIKDEFFDAPKSYEFLKAGKTLDIIYEDENLLLLDKKAGVITHQDAKYDSDTLNLRVQRYLYEKGEYDPEKDKAFSPALCNRIDRNTAGIVIAAKNAEALRIINRMIREREIEKYYLCIVKGTPTPQHAVITACHSKDESTNTVKITDTLHENSKEIITEYTVLDSKDGMSLCEILLHTGRTHQIRAHMAHIGHPLLGDTKYGIRAFNEKHGKKHQALYAYKLRFAFENDAGVLEYLNGQTFEVPNVPFADNKMKLK